ncbi:uncharacterized protein CMU_014250 [Cryptosporidium muris RN66]|uniref:Uncharacterized protein n=1 Tax=Cryptosporidium muris (strain RN66) TaxID=441375 RepID=B6AEY2_CRYMR|nr:uncharacterized protein CMU_014250 [Cryptosporidium muris RN66]EEA06749.1 hypothetical protein, conserved [Cryptosporidium muris RN66]|eukprot:XP_002141098.1 hypothetical protein [Cryptosporidium muris RN66]
MNIISSSIFFYWIIVIYIYIFLVECVEQYSNISNIIDNWKINNSFNHFYSKFNTFSVIILARCSDKKWIQKTLNNILYSCNRNLLHEIIIVDAKCDHEIKVSDILYKHFKDSSLIKLIETEYSNIGNLQLIGAEQAEGQILVFLPGAVALSLSWMASFLRIINEDQKSIVTSYMTKLNIEEWNFNNKEFISPGFIFSIDKNFDLANKSSDNKIPMFISNVFALSNKWWKFLSKFSTPYINSILGDFINIDISMRSWYCGGTVKQTKESIIALMNPNILELDQDKKFFLVESWFDDQMKKIVYNNSQELNNLLNFYNSTDTKTSKMKISILQRVEHIKSSTNCDILNFRTNFDFLLHEIGLIPYKTSKIKLKDSNLCITISDYINGSSTEFNLILEKCEYNNKFQEFYWDPKVYYIRNNEADLCIQAPGINTEMQSENMKVLANKCSRTNVYHKWEIWNSRIIFGSYCIQNIEKEFFLTKCEEENSYNKKFQEFSF